MSKEKEKRTSCIRSDILQKLIIDVVYTVNYMDQSAIRLSSADPLSHPLSQTYLYK